MTTLAATRLPASPRSGANRLSARRYVVAMLTRAVPPGEFDAGLDGGLGGCCHVVARDFRRRRGFARRSWNVSQANTPGMNQGVPL